MVDFLTKVLPYLIALNLALSAVAKILDALHKASPPWLQTVVGALKNLIDWLSANPAHPIDSQPPKA